MIVWILLRGEKAEWLHIYLPLPQGFRATSAPTGYASSHRSNFEREVRTISAYAEHSQRLVRHLPHHSYFHPGDHKGGGCCFQPQIGLVGARGDEPDG